jgi:hypothetical protein
MWPAHQSLEAFYFARLRVGLWLIVDVQAPTAQCGVQVALESALGLILQIHIWLKETEYAPPCRFRTVQGKICSLHQHFRVGSIAREDRNSDADSNLWAFEPRPKHGNQPLGKLCRCGRLEHLRLENGKLIAAQSGKLITHSDVSSKRRSNVSQQIVSGCVTQCVVNRFESVEVQAKYCNVAAACLGAGKLLLKAMLEARPIRQPGEAIMIGQVQRLIGCSPNLFSEPTGAIP